MTEPPNVAVEIRLTRWTNGEWSVTEDHGSYGETVTVETGEEAVERVREILLGEREASD